MQIVCLTPSAWLTTSPLTIGRAMESCPHCSHLHQDGGCYWNLSLWLYTCFADVFFSSQTPFTQISDSLPHLLGCCEQQLILPSLPRHCVLLACLTSHTQIMQLFLPFQSTDFPGHSIGKVLFPSLFTSCFGHMSIIFLGFDTTVPVPLRPFEEATRRILDCLCYATWYISLMPSFFLLPQILVTCAQISPQKYTCFLSINFEVSTVTTEEDAVLRHQTWDIITA